MAAEEPRETPPPAEGADDGGVEGDGETGVNDDRPGDPTVPVLGYARPGTANYGADFVTVATFGHAWEAHLALGKLEAAGIPASIADENVVAASGGLYTNLVGGVKLRVPRAEVDRALAALPRRVRAKIVKCPKCSSTETHQADFDPGVKILFLLMLGIPYLFVEKPWVCLGCGNVWRAARERNTDEDEDDEDEDDADPDDDAPEPAEPRPPFNAT